MYIVRHRTALLRSPVLPDPGSQCSDVSPSDGTDVVHPAGRVTCDVDGGADLRQRPGVGGVERAEDVADAFDASEGVQDDDIVAVHWTTVVSSLVTLGACMSLMIP